MLNLSSFLRAFQWHVKNTHISNKDFVTSFFFTLCKHKDGTEEAKSWVLSDSLFKDANISEMLNGKATLPNHLSKEIVKMGDEKLQQAFAEICTELLDKRRIHLAHQDLLELAKADPYCEDLIDDYEALGDDHIAFFAMAFVDALAKRREKSTLCGKWHICDGVHTGKGPLQIAKQIMENDRTLYDLPPECSGTAEQWATMIERFPEGSRFLMKGGKVHGNFSFVVLTEEEEEEMLRGRLIDRNIDTSRCGSLSEGTYSIYLLNLSINPNVPLEWYTSLWNAFFEQVGDFAKRGIYITRIYTKVFIPEHQTRMLGRGFFYHCDDAIRGKIYIRKIVHSSSDVEGDDLPVELANKIAAQEAYYSLFRQIDELFLDARFAPLKPFFFEEMELHEEDDRYELGVAIAEFMRDAMRYTSALVSYAPPHRRRSHRDFLKVLSKSKLICRSDEPLRLTTAIGNQNAIAAINPTAILSVGRIRLDLDRMFLEKDLLSLRAFFSERSDELPQDNLEGALAVTIRLMSGILIEKQMLEHLPNSLVISFHTYVKRVSQTRLVQEALMRYPFLQNEWKN